LAAPSCLLRGTVAVNREKRRLKEEGTRKKNDKQIRMEDGGERIKRMARDERR
jgi:hypothetical protein